MARIELRPAVLAAALLTLPACQGDSPTTSTPPPAPPPPGPPVAPVATTLTVTPDSLLLPVGGDTARFTAVVRDQEGKTMSGQTVVWSSSDTTVARISSTGLVTSVRRGTTVISATVATLEAEARAIVKLQLNAQCQVPGGFPAKPAVGAAPSFTARRSEILAPYGITMAAALDVDSDGDQDVVVFSSDVPDANRPPGDYRGATLVWRNDGSGGFVDATSEVLGGVPVPADYPRFLEVVDVNGDGRLDVFVGQHGDESAPNPNDFPGAPNLLLIQQGDRTLREEASTRLSPYERDSYTHGIAAGDIDCDGDVDLFESNWMTRKPHLQVNQGGGFFRAEDSRLPTEVLHDEYPWRDWASAAICDVDRDGDNDMFLGAASTEAAGGRRNWLLRNDGFGRFASAPASALPDPHWGLAQNEAVESQCADLDLDGWNDLLVSSTTRNPFYDSPHIALLLNNQDGTFRDASSTHLPQSWGNGWVQRIHVTDLNRDGWPDLVASNLGVDTRVFTNRGDARFTEQVMPRFAFNWGTTWNTWYPVDADGDGRIDLLAIGLDDNSSFWFRNTGP